MSESVTLQDDSELDDNLESPAKRKMCETLLPLDFTASTTMLSVIAVLHVEKVKTTYAVFMFTMMTLSLVAYGGMNLVWRLRQRAKVSELREKLRLNDELRSDDKITFEEWKRTYDALSPDDWPLVWKINLAGETGIDVSLIGLGLFAAWAIFEAARLI
jgi:hypothetical protein